MQLPYIGIHPVNGLLSMVLGDELKGAEKNTGDHKDVSITLPPQFLVSGVTSDTSIRSVLVTHAQPGNQGQVLAVR